MHQNHDTSQPDAPTMWVATEAAEDTYCPKEAERLTSTVQRTAPLHGSVRRAIAAALTTALIALGEDWRAEARQHYPQVFTELAGEPAPLAVAR